MDKGRSIVVPEPEIHGSKVTYNFDLPKKEYKVYYSANNIELDTGCGAPIAMVALAAMRLGVDIKVRGDVSATFLNNQYRLMEIFCEWFPQYSPIKIQCNKVKDNPVKTGRVGALFTGGVDSFYTYQKHAEEITDLVFVHGYDVRLSDAEKRATISKMGKELQKELGVRFIELETNSIRLFRDYGRWGLHAHGYGLGAAARLLSGCIDKLYIPSSFPWGELFPWASHPETDPLFSDESLMIVHDGCEASRTEKLNAIADNAMAQKYLRVCTAKIHGLYNCGLCEKCMRTMTGLYAIGKLNNFQTFPATLNQHNIRNIIVSDDSSRRFVRDNISLLEKQGMGSDPVCQAWSDIYHRSYMKTKYLKTRKYLRKRVNKLKSKLKLN
jgi:hypothetical protein